MIRWKVTNLSRESLIVLYCRYKRIYNEGMTIRAESNSLGLMTFKRKKDAIKFAKRISFGRKVYYKILKIQSIGRGFVPKKISMSVSIESLNYFYSDDLSRQSCPPPDGTICYKSIKVLT